MPRGLRRLESAWFALQAALVSGFWTWMALSPSARGWFFPVATEGALVAGFACADGVVLVAGSAAAAVGAVRSRRWAFAVGIAVTGASLYATCWCAAVAIATGEALLAVLLMALATAASAIASAGLRELQ